MKLATLYKRTKTGAIQQWSIHVENNTFYTKEGQVDGAITSSKPTICESKNSDRSNARSPEEQAEAEALAKWTKQKKRGYTENIKDIDNITKYEPMLAHKFEKYEKDISYPCLCQRKSDGIRCLITKDSAKSRNGENIVTVPHIQNALKSVFDLYPDTILDGELYNHELHADFNKIASLVKKTKPSIEDLFEAEEKVQYHVYDAPRIAGLTESAPYMDRYNKICELLKNVPYIHIVKTYTLEKGKIQEMHDKFVEEGYEGLMVRFNSPYHNGRSKYLLKFKYFDTEEFTILDIQPGRGNKADMAGNVYFRTKEGKSFTAGIIGDSEYCKTLLYNKEEYLGKLATVKFFRYTPDGIPRFPKVLEMDRRDI